MLQSLEEKQELLQKSEVSLWIDHYDDIFSDFDPRPYSQRGLSDDFLIEAKKFIKEKASGSFELIFLVPELMRKPESEGIIKKRLREHFKKHHLLLKHDMVKIKKKGIALAAVGMLLMFAAYLVTTVEQNMLMNLIFIILEPSGWFLAFIGMEHIFYETKGKTPDLEFYTKMSRCEIKFRSY
ncbi:MAG: hypothetical protein AABW48_03495 [Nanoarchaeota archaeon]